MQFPHFPARTFPGAVNRYLRLYAVFVIAAAMLFPAAARAQFRASLTGVVTDTQGGIIPGATMSVPSSPNPGIVYAIPSDVHSLYGYPPNPNTIVSFGANGLPSNGQVSVQAFQNNLPTMYTEHWSLDTETDLGYQFLLTVGYQGSVMRHTISGAAFRGSGRTSICTRTPRGT